MKTRTITGVIIGVLVYLTLWLSHIPVILYWAVLILSVLSVCEIYHAADMIREKAAFVFALLLAVMIVFLPIPYYPQILAVLFFLAVCIYTWMMIYPDTFRRQKRAVTVWNSCAAVFLFKAIIELRNTDNGIYYLTLSVTVCFVTDIAAYLIGKNYGKRKLVPSVSPNKTVAGSAAGILSALLVMLICGVILVHMSGLDVNYPMLAIYAVLAAVVGEFGDLAMSISKRIYGVKDFGNLLPGHGGLLDRFDSHMFTVAFTLLFYTVTGGCLM